MIATTGLPFCPSEGERSVEVQTLESGQAPLEESISVYERGALLKAHCEKKLEAARLRVEKVVLAQGAATGVEPAEFG